MTKPGTTVSRFGVTACCEWLHVTLLVPSVVLSCRLSSRLVASESTFKMPQNQADAAANRQSATTIRPIVVVAVSYVSSSLLIDLDLDLLLSSPSLLASASTARRVPKPSQTIGVGASVIEYMYT